MGERRLAKRQRRIVALQNSERLGVGEPERGVAMAGRVGEVSRVDSWLYRVEGQGVDELGRVAG